MSIYAFQKTWIALIIIEEVTIFKKYTNFANVLLKKLVKIISNQTSINKYANKLENGMQSNYKLIYSLLPVELQIFKIYIKINLVNSFIWLFKFFANTLILFVQKSNSSFCLNNNCQELNNFIINN